MISRPIRSERSRFSSCRSSTRTAPSAIALAVTLSLGACGGSGDGSDGPAAGSDGNPGGAVAAPAGDDAIAGIGGTPEPETSVVEGVDGNPTNGARPDGSPPGDIVRYGVIAVGDEDGTASGEAIASFSRLSTAVSIDAFGVALDTEGSVCTVTEEDGRPDLTLASALYLPEPDGASLETIFAGEAVPLSNPDGGWIELQARPSDRLYTRPFADAPPIGPVPDALVANVPGGEFPPFVDAPFPAVAPLTAFLPARGEPIGIDTRFTWEPSGAANARVRIESTSVTSFFDDRGLSVSCLAPDTGEFRFPDGVRAMLGASFEGEAPDVSRVAVSSVREEDALLVLVRESVAR